MRNKMRNRETNKRNRMLLEIVKEFMEVGAMKKVGWQDVKYLIP